MKDSHIQDIPSIYPQIEAKSEEIGFTMPSDLYIGTLLKTLMSSKPGGCYVIDDMTEQPNWPEGHTDIVDYLEKREDFVLTKMNWSTGVIVAVRVG